MTTESERHHLYNRLTEALDLEGAAALMEIVSPLTRDELATKGDLAELRADFQELRSEVRSDLSELKTDLSRTFATWLFLSQGVMVAIVGLLLSMR